ncbi:MAG TPA: phosphoribosyltransferase family protein [Candidatus Paceibacterota bacterium]|nr:phosphoribosyltransferase family protein [Candidatus Paceibacterota bacterium]
MFLDRKDAGAKLAESLRKYKDNETIILALPRGGVELGREVADDLSVPLDIISIRKIGHPTSPEYAICAINEEGELLCNEIERAMVEEKWLKEESEKQKNEAARRARIYRAGKELPDIENKSVILIDDGMATGLTMRLAVAAVKRKKPKQTIVAVPVAPPDAIEQIMKEVQEIVVLEPPENFLGSVGAHYLEFDQVTDEKVIDLMRVSKI